MRTLAIAGVVAATILFVAPRDAAAWWDFAKWGMTVDQLKKASGGRVVECQGLCKGTFIGFRPTHTIPGVEVAGYLATATFAFDGAGRLNWTVLEFGDRSFNPLERALMGVYGAPIDNRSRDSVRAITWKDAAKGSTIRLIEIGPSFVEYKPLATGL